MGTSSSASCGPDASPGAACWLAARSVSCRARSYSSSVAGPRRRSDGGSELAPAPLPLLLPIALSASDAAAASPLPSPSAPGSLMEAMTRLRTACSIATPSAACGTGTGVSEMLSGSSGRWMCEEPAAAALAAAATAAAAAAAVGEDTFDEGPSGSRAECGVLFDLSVSRKCGWRNDEEAEDGKTGASAASCSSKWARNWRCARGRHSTQPSPRLHAQQP